MKKDIILCGVGGQGILSIATVIAEAATEAGLYIKQSEVHGMSQRGGDVQSHLRLSTEPVLSDLISLGGADLVISMEPMEALRYRPWMGDGCVTVSASRPFVNIPDYPSEEALDAELAKLPHLVSADTDAVASAAGMARGANMVLLGMAAPFLGILDAGQLREALRRIFKRKGDAVVEANCKCFDAGVALSTK